MAASTSRGGGLTSVGLCFFGKTSGWPNAHSVDSFFVFFAITALTRAIGDAVRLVGK